MRKKPYSYDQSCYDLAQRFLSDEKIPSNERHDACEALAQAIQNTVEDFFTFDLEWKNGERALKRSES